MSDTSKTAQMAEILSKTHNSIDERLIKKLLEMGEASYKDLAAELGVKPTSVGRHVKKMRDEGLVFIYKKDNKNFVKWIGGTPAIESELIRATNEHVRASLLAENYDSMITNAYSLFSLLFENHYWEIIMNLKEGLTDLELSQRTGNAITLDSIRRVLVTCDHHDLIKLNTIRGPAGNDPIKIFEPLYRIDKVNAEYLEYFIVIRGLASAVITRMGGKIPNGYAHLYSSLLNSIVPMFFSLKDKVVSNLNESDNKILEKMLLNYDFAPDMDRMYGPDINWRKLLNVSNNVKIDDRTDHLIIREALSEKYEKAMIERVIKK
ncbi:Bacterial regulatory protein, arsR family [uncultured archaeon]|nr:Bacterial regulatory protein, arsR family [uncultured archaeon]